MYSTGVPVRHQIPLRDTGRRVPFGIGWEIVGVIEDRAHIRGGLADGVVVASSASAVLSQLLQLVSDILGSGCRNRLRRPHTAPPVAVSCAHAAASDEDRWPRSLGGAGTHIMFRRVGSGSRHMGRCRRSTFTKQICRVSSRRSKRSLTGTPTGTPESPTCLRSYHEAPMPGWARPAESTSRRGDHLGQQAWVSIHDPRHKYPQPRAAGSVRRRSRVWCTPRASAPRLWPSVHLEIVIHHGEIRRTPPGPRSPQPHRSVPAVCAGSDGVEKFQ